MSEGKYVDSLISEYTILLKKTLSKNKQSEYNKDDITKDLILSADWSCTGANELLTLVNDYGAFMLRNALALAVALGKEDGALEF